MLQAERATLLALYNLTNFVYTLSLERQTLSHVHATTSKKHLGE